MSLCVRFIVLSTIEFYRQFNFTTVEIQNKPLKWMLSAKTETTKLLAAQTIPNQLFGIGHGATQSTCGLEQRQRDRCWNEELLGSIHNYTKNLPPP